MSAVPEPRARQAVYTEMQAEWLRRDLRRYTAAAWHLVEARPFKGNWHLDAICDHLAYVSIGDILRSWCRGLRARRSATRTGSCAAHAATRAWPT